MHDRGTGPETGKDLLVASIAVDDGSQFAVTLIPATRGTAQHHYVRFALHYYARALYLLAHGEHAGIDLPTLIDLIIRTSIDRGSDLFLLAGLDGSLVPEIAKPAQLAELVMKSKGAHECELIGNIDFQDWALSHSVIAVLQSLTDRLSEENLATLAFGLENMNASYSTVYRHADPDGLEEVPRIAFQNASGPAGRRGAAPSLPATRSSSFTRPRN